MGQKIVTEFLYNQLNRRGYFTISREIPPQYLYDVMAYLQQKCSKFTGIQKCLKKNSPLLMYACSRDNNELVKVLVNHGCRLYTSHNLNIFHKVYTIYLPVFNILKYIPCTL